MMMQATLAKAIWGVVLMVNLALVPFYNAAIAAGNNEPMPYTPDNTPEWRFGSAEDGAGVATVAAGVMGVMGVVGMEAEVSLQPEFEDHVLKDIFDFHVLAFETVFGRAYEEEDACYLFEQPLDESTYGTVVPGWNAANEPVDALVLDALPIDVSYIIVEPDSGITIVSAAHIAGTLEGVGKQGFWGLSMVYDDSDGVRYHDLFLLNELDATTEEILMFEAGLLEYTGGREEGDLCYDEYVICQQGAGLDALACRADADAEFDRCLIGKGGRGFEGDSFQAGLGIIAWCVGVGGGAAVIGINVILCMKARADEYKACAIRYTGDMLRCKAVYLRCTGGDTGDAIE